MGSSKGSRARREKRRALKFYREKPQDSASSLAAAIDRSEPEPESARAPRVSELPRMDAAARPSQDVTPPSAPSRVQDITPLARQPSVMAPPRAVPTTPHPLVSFARKLVAPYTNEQYTDDWELLSRESATRQLLELLQQLKAGLLDPEMRRDADDFEWNLIQSLNDHRLALQRAASRALPELRRRMNHLRRKKT